VVFDLDVAGGAVVVLRALDHTRHGHEIAELMSHDPGSGDRTNWARYESCRDLARRIANDLEDEPLSDGVSNWLERAVNAPAGRLAEFWLRVVAIEWSENRDGWSGLPQDVRAALAELLAKPGAHGALAEVILASQLHFLFAADREWSLATILPLLAWNDSARARRTWDGFLYWGRWTDPLLELGLLAQYLDAAKYAEDFDDEVRRQFGEHLATISLLSAVDPTSWIGRFTRAASDEIRVDWLNHIAWTLKRVDPEVAERQWARWMREYWTQRLQSVPLRMSFGEATAMATWIVTLGGATEEAVALAVATPAGLEPHGGLIRELTAQVERAPRSYARLLAHLLAGTTGPFWECDALEAFVSTVRGQAAEHDVRLIREQGLRLGCNRAAEW
jgi:hypothetical protein